MLCYDHHGLISLLPVIMRHSLSPSFCVKRRDTISSGFMRNRISSCTRPELSTPPPIKLAAKSTFTHTSNSQTLIIHWNSCGSLLFGSVVTCSIPVPWLSMVPCDVTCSLGSFALQLWQKTQNKTGLDLTPTMFWITLKSCSWHSGHSCFPQNKL